ncbi:MAG: hypothetical protein ACR2QT_08470 [Woeseiaceae bacterium]
MRKTTISSKSILVVHGRDFKPAEDALRDVSTAALRAGIQRDYPDQLYAFDKVSVEFAYYGDLSNEVLGARGNKYDQQIDVGDRANALNCLRDIDARKRFGIRQYDCVPGKTAVPEFFANVISPLFGLLGMTNSLVSWLSPDFSEYLKAESEYAEKVRERVRTQLCALIDRGGRIMLATHGTGCVIAYDVLWQLSHDERFVDKYGDAKVDCWLTLGAPLGDNCIRKRLLGFKGEPKTYPKNVISWHNIAAEDDYTCHDNTLADDFKKMLEQRVVSTVQDYRVYNLATRYGKSNPHSSVGYYIHPRVSKIIVDWAQTPAIETDPIYTL